MYTEPEDSSLSAYIRQHSDFDVPEKMDEALQHDFDEFCNRQKRLGQYAPYVQFTQALNAQVEQIKERVLAQRFILANGKKGQPYAQTLRIPDECGSDYELKGLAELGLRWKRDAQDKSLVHIQGTPCKHGDFSIELAFRPQTRLPTRTWLSAKIGLYINADPRDLWKDLEPPADIAYPKKHIASASDFQAQNLPFGKLLLAASRRGRSHANDAKPRDDDFSIKHCTSTGWYIMAAADGAGSAEFSREGSRIACKEAMAFCTEKLCVNNRIDELIEQFAPDIADPAKYSKLRALLYQLLPYATLQGHKAIVAEAQKTGRQAKQYSTTLLLAVCKHFDFGWFVASFGVGDGAMAIYTKSQELILLATPDEGEFGGQTRFITMKSVFEDPKELSARIRIHIVPDFTAIALMTDGVSDAKFETDYNLAQLARWDMLWEDINASVDLAKVRRYPNLPFATQAKHAAPAVEDLTLAADAPQARDADLAAQAPASPTDQACEASASAPEEDAARPCAEKDAADPSKKQAAIQPEPGRPQVYASQTQSNGELVTMLLITKTTSQGTSTEIITSGLEEPESPPSLSAKATPTAAPAPQASHAEEKDTLPFDLDEEPTPKSASHEMPAPSPARTQETAPDAAQTPAQASAAPSSVSADDALEDFLGKHAPVANSPDRDESKTVCCATHDPAPVEDAPGAGKASPDEELVTPEKLEAQLVEWLNFWSVGNHDDRTLVLLF